MSEFTVVDNKVLIDLYNEVKSLKALIESIGLIKPQESDKKDDFMNNYEAAKYLKMSYDTLARHVKAGLIPYRIIGRKKFFVASELDEYTKSFRSIKTFN